MNSFDNLIIKRRINITNELNTFFPKDISKFISEYDYYLHGTSHILKETSDNVYNIATLPNEQIIVGTIDNKIEIFEPSNESHSITITDFSGSFCVNQC